MSVRAISPCQSGVLVRVSGGGGVIVGVNQGYWSVSVRGISPCQRGY